MAEKAEPRAREENISEAEVIYRLDELRVLCKQYQVLLGLQDWEVKICFANQMTMPEYEAQVTTESKTKRALISIVSPDTFASSMNTNQDMFHALIHELLHLHFVTFFRPEDRSTEGRLFELALNKIAKAIATLNPNPLYNSVASVALRAAQERENETNKESVQTELAKGVDKRGGGGDSDSE